MHINRTLLVLALVALPALAGAQRGVNIKGERAGDIGGRGFQMPRSSDLADHSPVGVVLDKKKKLALTDSQVTALKAVAKGLQEKNAASYRGWDSVRVTMRAASGGAFGGGGGGRGTAGMGGGSEVDRQTLSAARAHMMSLLRVIRENDEWSRQETLKLLTAEQQPKAESYWKDDADDFGRTLPAAGVPGGGRPGGGGPPAR
ncbi:MAG: hypothetical protein ACYC7F_10505 [Gemmatimonadaceae bacterium]